MTPADVIILGILVLVMAAIFMNLRQRKKKGSGCSGCSGCSHCKQCGSEPEDQK